jgi:uncharacterized protein (DUF1697 family)
MIVALLRGINVGGAHRLPMATLRDGLAAIGCTSVTTYIQSGNVVLDLPRNVDDADAWLTAQITSIAGFAVPTITRTADDMAAVVAANPFPSGGGTGLHVTFFADPPPASLFTGVDVDALAPEACALRGRELYMYLPLGAGRAKLPLLAERAGRRCGVAGTTRNWNTVTTLADLSRRA